MIIVIYKMKIQAGLDETFRQSTSQLASALGKCEGSLNTLVAKAEENSYIFIEHWHDDNARTVAGATIDKQIFKNLFGTLSGKPEMIHAETLAES